jgi:branched-chain amino acid transport system substrate-binding protein
MHRRKYPGNDASCTGASRPRTVVASGTILLATLLVAACGSQSNSGVSSASASDAKATPIPIGVVGSYSGPFSDLLGVGRPVIQAWADTVNAAGGLKGHPVKLYIEDDQDNVSLSVTEVKTLVEQDHVVAIVGQEADGGDEAWAPYVERMGIPVVGGENSEPVYLTNPDFFDPIGDLISSFYGIAAQAHANGPKFAAVYCAESPACAEVTTILGVLDKSPGASVNLAYTAKVAAAAPDYTAQCEGLKQSGAQSYTMSISVSVQKRFVAQCAQDGVTARPIDNVVDSTFTSVPAFNGMQIVDSAFPFFDQSIPATKAFHEALAKYAPQVGTASMPLDYIASDIWTAGALFQAAVDASGPGPVTSASIKRGLYSLKGTTLGGLTAPLTFTPGKVALNNSYFPYEIKNGAFVETHGMTPVTVPSGPINALVAALSK